MKKAKEHGVSGGTLLMIALRTAAFLFLLFTSGALSRRLSWSPCSGRGQRGLPTCRCCRPRKCFWVCTGSIVVVSRITNALCTYVPTGLLNLRAYKLSFIHVMERVIRMPHKRHNLFFRKFATLESLKFTRVLCTLVLIHASSHI